MSPVRGREQKYERRNDMGDMERAAMEGPKEDHKAVDTAISTLEKLGYLIEGIRCKNGVLDITCRHPRNEENNLSMDGVSETFKV
jgi:hypothetical protein